MFVNENYIALIEKYLDGSMSEADQSDFDRLQKQSPEFRDQLKEAQDTIVALKQNFHTNLKADLTAMYGETVRDEKGKKKNRRIYYWAAAAVLILGVGATWSYYANRTSGVQELFLTHYQVYPIKPTTRSAEQEEVAVAYYQDGKFDLALPLLLANLQRYRDDDVLKLYVGNCYLNLGNYRAAITTFKEGGLSEDNIVRQTSKWYLALSHLAASEVTESVALLQDIVQRDELYAPDASRLLQDVSLVK